MNGNQWVVGMSKRYEYKNYHGVQFRYNRNIDQLAIIDSDDEIVQSMDVLQVKWDKEWYECCRELDKRETMANSNFIPDQDGGGNGKEGNLLSGRVDELNMWEVGTELGGQGCER